MSNCMEFPKDYNDFIDNYSASKEVYASGLMLMPSFRVIQMIRHYFDKDDSPTQVNFIENCENRLAVGKDILSCPGISINAEHAILTVIGCDGQVVSYDLAPNLNELNFIEVNGVTFMKDNSK